MDDNQNHQLILHCMYQAWQELSDYLLKHPDKLATQPFTYWQSDWNLGELFSLEATALQKNYTADKRFQHPDWQTNLIFHFIYRCYQLLSHDTKYFIKKLNIKDIKLEKKFQLYSRQFLDAVSPTNFAITNPDILATIIQTKGENLITGFKRFREDLARGEGALQIPLTDTSQFTLGKNIACTAGKIIYQNHLMQLIQYTATTNEVHRSPLLIIPPWINKYYIFDLQPENSLVKWLVDHGLSVFMISWINPSKQHKDISFADYMRQGPLAALEKISQITHQQPVNLLGYCIGGTLLGCLLAYLACANNKFNIASATLLTTLFDFSAPGELGLFIDEQKMDLLENEMNRKGYLDGKIMASIFNALRANDLIWSAFVNRYLKGEEPKPFDFLYWNADSTNIPAAAHHFYLRHLYLDNLLIQPNQIHLNKVPIDLSQITVPCYFLAAHDDHIAPWESCYQSHQYLKAPAKFVLAGSGHVAGIINPPHKKKYGYWTNTKKLNSASAKKFISTAIYHTGSWWDDWLHWLRPHIGPLIKPSQLKKMKKIEDAPGSYVKIKLTDIAKQEE